MGFEASCHCGAVTLSVAADAPTEAMNCNCSHCRRKGFLLAFFPTEQVAVAGEAALSEYRFNQHKLAHRFCATCGVQPFAEGQGPGGAAMRAVNLRCAPGIDLDALTIQKVDGASF